MEKLKQSFKPSDVNNSLHVEKVCYWFIEQLKDVAVNPNDPTFAKEASEGRVDMGACESSRTVF